VPSQVIALDTFPITDRGKVNKRALLQMAVEQAEQPV
jgi:non-ribosomal peptide synthetase component E (peptide arylation enzyme)